MAENQSGCLTEHQIKAANILYTSLSFGSFMFGLVTVVLTRCYYYHYKDKYPVDPTEGIFFLLLFACTILELVDSFQWVLLLRSSVPCTVLGAIREYLLISLLVIQICLGIHLFILMTHPKCLRVIKEEKQKRFKLLQRSYMIAASVLPALIVPWPFIEIGYGKDDYLCWLAYDCNASTVSASRVVLRLLMWHFWAVLVWMFAVIMFIIAVYHYCTSKSAVEGTKSKRSHNVVCTIVLLLLIFIINVAANGVLFIWGFITGKISYPATLQAAILTPLMIMVYALILTIRQVKFIMSKSREILSTANASSVATQAKSYGALTSHTKYILPDDEWN